MHLHCPFDYTLCKGRYEHPEPYQMPTEQRKAVGILDKSERSKNFDLVLDGVPASHSIATSHSLADNTDRFLGVELRDHSTNSDSNVCQLSVNSRSSVVVHA